MTQTEPQHTTQGSSRKRRWDQITRTGPRCAATAANRAHTHRGGRSDHIPHLSHHLPLANAHSARTTHTLQVPPCARHEPHRAAGTTTRTTAQPWSKGCSRYCPSLCTRLAHEAHESPGQRTQHKTVHIASHAARTAQHTSQIDHVSTHKNSACTTLLTPHAGAQCHPAQTFTQTQTDKAP